MEPRDVPYEDALLGINARPGLTISSHHPNGATVLFADLVNFTTFSQTVSPEVLVGMLDRIFTRFDALAVRDRRVRPGRPSH